MSVHIYKGDAKKCVMGRKSLYTYTDTYDELFVEKIKLLPVRYFHPESKEWELPLTSLPVLLKNFPGVQIEGDLSEADKLRFKTLDEYKAYLSTLTPKVSFDFKTKPDPHQIEWFNQMIDKDRVILGDPMGLGKTKEALDACEYRLQYMGYMKILFICKAKHKDNMAKEIQTHTNSKYIVVDGDRKHRLQALRDYYMDMSIPYLIIGYESAMDHAEELKTIARDIRFDAVIMDEFNKIKNWVGGQKKGSKRGHITIEIVNLIEFINPRLIILASGTPLTKRPTDLYAPLRLTGVETHDFNWFKNRYCLLDDFGTIKGSKNEQELSDKLWSVMIRRPKELLGLQAPRITYMPVKMTPAQAKLYNAVRLQIKEELKGTKAYGANELALLTRLRQVTTNPRLIDSEVEGIKELVADEYLADVIESGEKAVIYSIYKEETKLLQERFRNLNPAYIDGTLNSKRAQAEVDRLQTDPECKLLIGSLHAVKESYTMTAANHAIFLDQSWTVTDNDQARDRIHRRGQTKPTHILIPYCIGTIDERVLDILAKDAGLIAEVTDQGIRQSIDSAVVDFLLS